jgi:hypothetical protein
MSTLISNAISIKEAVAMVMACPELTYCFEGSPGVGKTYAPVAIMGQAGYHVRLKNCQNMLMEDTGAWPIVDPVTKTTTLAPLAEWAPRPGKEVWILDELPKAREEVFNAFNPMLYGKPRSFMGFEYPEDTGVIITCNSAVFNAGDNIRPHHINRMVRINIADPARDEALATMTMLGFDARIIEWVQATPRALTSYDPAMQSTKAKSDALQTYFGFLEASPMSSFCSMRSLEAASKLFKKSHLVSPDTFRANLVGTVGVNAALSMLMFAGGIAEFVSPDDIISHPLEAKVPKSPFDQRMAGTTAAAIINKSNYTAVLQYVDRLHKDVADNIFAARLVHKDGAIRVIPAIAKRMAAAL